MTKAELAAQVSKNTGIDEATVIRTIEAANKVITRQVAHGDGVYIRGFGSYIPKDRAAKTARNIKAGTRLKLEATVIPFFKPSPDFKRAVAKQFTEQ